MQNAFSFCIGVSLFFLEVFQLHIDQMQEFGGGVTGLTPL